MDINKVKKVKDFILNPEFSIFKELAELNEGLKKIEESKSILSLDLEEINRIKGERGEKGNKGEQGEQGILGEKGEPGQKGERGEMGKQGINGDTGNTGIDGKDGKDGLDGKDGKDAKIDDVLKELKNPKSKHRLESKDIKGFQNVNTFRWGGGMTRESVQALIDTSLGTKAPSANPTFTGTTIQSGNINLNLPASDHIATGLTTNAILSGATIAAFQLVFLGTDGKWLLVDANAVATCKGMIGIALEAKNDTEAMLVALPGSFVRDDTWAWTIGNTLYAGETPGTIQNTIPTGADAIIKVIGFAVSADVIFFNPSPDQQSTVA